MKCDGIIGKFEPPKKLSNFWKKIQNVLNSKYWP